MVISSHARYHPFVRGDLIADIALIYLEAYIAKLRTI